MLFTQCTASHGQGCEPPKGTTPVHFSPQGFEILGPVLRIFREVSGAFSAFFTASSLVLGPFSTKSARNLRLCGRRECVSCSEGHYSLWNLTSNTLPRTVCGPSLVKRGRSLYGWVCCHVTRAIEKNSVKHFRRAARRLPALPGCSEHGSWTAPFAHSHSRTSHA